MSGNSIIEIHEDRVLVSVDETRVDVVSVGTQGPPGPPGIPGTPLVVSVAGKQGVVTLSKADVGLNLVDNTPDSSKPVSTAQQSAMAAKQDNLTLAQFQLLGRIAAGSGNVTGGINYSATAQSNSIAQRDSAGALTVATPTSTGHAATKAYVDARLLQGAGLPNGSVVANVGTIYVDAAVTNGVSTWLKKSGSGNTGWVVYEANYSRQLAATPSQNTNYFELCRTGAIVASSWSLLVIDLYNTIGVSGYNNMQYARYKISMSTDASNVPIAITAVKVYGDSATAGVFTAVANADATISIWANNPSLTFRSAGITSAYSMSNTGSQQAVYLPMTSQATAPTGSVTTSLT